MKRSLLSITGIVILLVILLLVNGLSGKLFGRFTLDLTSDKLYSLSDGSKNILHSIPDDQKITLRYYYSATDSRTEPAVQFYGKTIVDILHEYERQSEGKVKLFVYDPRPDTEEEEWALKYGLEPISLATGEQLFLGLVASSEDGKDEVISMFDLARQRFLEYDISRMIHSVLRPKKSVIGILSSVPLRNPNPMPSLTQQRMNPWFFISQLEQDAEIKYLNEDVEKIDDSVNLLMVVHPKSLSKITQYAIDQFVMRGGSLLALVDPYCENDSPEDAQNPLKAATASRSSDLNDLLSKWGVELEKGVIVADVNLATPVSYGQAGQAINFVLFPTLRVENIDRNDPATSTLSNITFPWVGSLKISPKEGVSYTKLLKSTSDSMLVNENEYRFQGGNPESLLASFAPDGNEKVFAVRISGLLKSAFPEGKPKEAKPETDNEQDQNENFAESKAPEKGFIAESKGIANVVVIADVDFISDRYSIIAQNFMGRAIVAMRNDNIPAVLNLADNLSGTNDLISIRSRGEYSRPFTRVQNMEKRAQQSLKFKEQELQTSLMRANERLQELQEQGGGKQQSSKLLGKALGDEITKVRQERSKIMKQVREVRRQFREEIEGLGNVLFLFNTFFVPLVLIVVGIVIWTKKKSVG